MENKDEMPELSSETADVPKKDRYRLTDSFRKISVTVGLIIAIIIFSSIALLTTLMVMAHDSVIRDSHAEYDYLRQLARSIKAEQGSLDDEMRQINPDYVCWLLIDGTAIDYPVVRGKDNEKYIKTSFKGEANIAGTLFMDYRNTGDLLSTDADESMRNILIYAHNVPQGGMFSELQKLISSQFLEENNIITLIVDDQEVKFKIFSVRVSDINDPAYFLNFSSPHAFNSFIDRIKAPITATQIITLSTCTRGGSNTARLIVQGYRLLD